MLMNLSSLYPLQAKNQASMLQLALQDLEAPRRQGDTALEASVGNLQAVDGRPPVAHGQRPLASHDDHRTLDGDLELLGGDPGQRDEYPQFIAGLVQIDRRFPARRALRGAQL